VTYVSGAAALAPGGVNVDPQTGDHTFSCPTDRLGEIEFNIPAAHGFYLPQAGSSACTQSSMAMVVRNAASSTAILTLCSGTGTSGSCTAGSSTFQPEATNSINLIPGAAAFVYSDATTSTGNYHDIPIASPFGGVNTQTANYTATLLDKDKLIVMNCASACALTLPAAPPSSKWNIGAMSIGSTLATVSLNSLNFNGGPSAPALIKYMPIMVRTDGSNYFGDAPLVAGSNVTLTPTANGVTVAASGGDLQTNGTNNSSQSVLNVINSTTNAVGLTLTCTNTTGGTVQCEIAGAAPSFGSSVTAPEFIGSGSNTGLLSLGYNAAGLPSLPSNSFGFTGFASAATSYFGQPSATAPSAGQVQVWGTPSGNISALTWLTPGTVTSVTTTSPITGGTITATGTIACATCTVDVASGTAAMGTSTISSGTCAAAVTVSASNVATTDIIKATPNTDPTAVTGYAPSSSGSLYIQAYPTSGNVNFKVCNDTSATLTPSALTLNWSVTR
jgi:hypothetical protein